MPNSPTVMDALHAAWRHTPWHASRGALARTAHDAITAYAGGSWSVVRVPDEDRPAADGDPLIYDPAEVIASLRSRDYYGTDGTNALMGQAANLLESLWATRAAESNAVPDPGADAHRLVMDAFAKGAVAGEQDNDDPDDLVTDRIRGGLHEVVTAVANRLSAVVPLDDERLQAIADLTKQAREDAEWRRTVTSALVGYNSSASVASSDAETSIRAFINDSKIVAELMDNARAVDGVLAPYRLRDETGLYFVGGDTPEGPIFTDNIARDVYAALHPEVTK